MYGIIVDGLGQVSIWYRRAIIGRMLGIFMMCTSFSQLVGPSFMGYNFDITGNYNLTLFIFIAVLIVSLPLAFFARPQRMEVSLLT